MTHSARPASDHALGCDVSALDDAKGGDQLLFKECAAASIIGERRCRGHDGDRATPVAVKALQAPDGGDDFCRDAIGGFKAVENISISCPRRAPARTPASRAIP